MEESLSIPFNVDPLEIMRRLPAKRCNAIPPLCACANIRRRIAAEKEEEEEEEEELQRCI